MNAKHKHLRIVTLLLALPLFVVSGFAAAYQGGGPMGPGGGRRGMMSPDARLKRMTKDLNLTSDQQAKIKPILVDEQNKMMDLRNDMSLDRQTMREKMMQLQKDTNDQIRALLNDQQKETFDKLQQARQDRMQNRRGGGMGGPGAANPGGGPPPQN
jgi:Spy/CpxP family protein refolding chaperone